MVWREMQENTSLISMTTCGGISGRRKKKKQNMTHTTTHTGRVCSARVQPRGVLENCWCALELGIGKNGLSWASSLRLQIVRRKFQSARSGTKA